MAIAILEGFNSLYKSQEHYIDYRVTSEQLRQEFSYFMSKSGDYTGLAAEGAYSKLVARTEGIMSGENSKWAEVTRQNDKATMANNIQDAVQEYLKKYGAPTQATPAAGNQQTQPAAPPQPVVLPPAQQDIPPPPPQPDAQAELQPPPVPQPPPQVQPEVLPESEIDPSDRNPEGN